MSALPEELGPLRSALTAPTVHHHAGREFITGRLDGCEVVLVLARIGKVAAAITATLLIERFGAEAIIFTGVAGGLHRDVQVGDVVVARELLQHDLDASPLFPRHEVPLTGRSRFAADADVADALAAAAHDALAVEMEGAAVAQVCHDCDVPFAVLRAISDRADANAHVDFRRFLADVAGPLAAAIVRRWLRLRGEPAPG